MSAKLTNIGSDLSKVDAHIITAEEYEEIPEVTDEFFEQADLHKNGELIRSGITILQRRGQMIETLAA